MRLIFPAPTIAMYVENMCEPENIRGKNIAKVLEFLRFTHKSVQGYKARQVTVQPGTSYAQQQQLPLGYRAAPTTSSAEGILLETRRLMNSLLRVSNRRFEAYLVAALYCIRLLIPKESQIATEVL